MARTIRLLLDTQTPSADLVDSNTGQFVSFYRAETLTFDVGLLQGGAVWNPTSGHTYSIEVKERNNPNYAAFFSATGTITGSLSVVSDFDGGSEHFSATITAAATESARVGSGWLVVKVMDSGGSVITTYAGEVSVLESGSSSLAQGSDYTASTYITTGDKGSASGVAELDSTGKVPAAQLPVSTDLNYQGVWDVTADSPNVSATSPAAGDFYIVSNAGTEDLTGNTNAVTEGDEMHYNGSAWEWVPKPSGVQSTKVFTTANKATTTPDFAGQYAVDSTVLATGDVLGALLIAGSTTTGDWDAVTVAEGSFSTALSTIFDKLERGYELNNPINPAYGFGGNGFGGASTGMPEAGGWTSDNLFSSPTPEATDDHHGFPGACWIPQMGRLLVTYRVANAHALGAAAMWVGYTDDMGSNWTTYELYDVANTDYKSMRVCLLQDGRLLGWLSRIDSLTDYELYVVYSEDGGLTWGTPELVVNGGSTVTQTASEPVQLRDGTIILPYYDATGAIATTGAAKLVRSTDNGATWSSAVTVASSGKSEMNIVQRHDTTGLVAIIRGENATPDIYMDTSSDGGATWAGNTNITSAVGSWIKGLPVIHLDYNNRLWMQSRITFAGSGLWYSDDYGTTWSDPAAGNSSTSYADTVDDGRSDILSDHNKWAEGSIVEIAPGALVAVMGGENTGQSGGSIYLRSWAVGMAAFGSQSGGIKTRGGGSLSFDTLTPPRLYDDERDALTAVAGMTVFNRSANCLETYNGTYWEAQAPATIPTINGVTSFADYVVEGIAAGTLATWEDDAGASDLAGTGDPTLTAAALRGREAIVFDGDDDYSDDAATWNFLHDGTTSWTIFVPFYQSESDPDDLQILFTTLDQLASTTRTGFILYVDDRSASSFSNCLQAAMTFSNGTAFSFSCQDTQAGGALEIQNNIRTQCWHVAAVSYSRSDATTGTMELFVDGVSQGSSSTNGARTASSTYDLHIGSGDSTNNYFTGKMGRLMAYKYLLSDHDIARISHALLR